MPSFWGPENSPSRKGPKLWEMNRDYYHQAGLNSRSWTTINRLWYNTNVLSYNRTLYLSKWATDFLVIHDFVFISNSFISNCTQIWKIIKQLQYWLHFEISNQFDDHGCLNLVGVFFPDFSRFSRQKFLKFPDFFTWQFWILGCVW